MNRKWFWVGIPVVAVLAVAASFLLRDRSAPLPEDEGAEAPAQQLEAVRAAPDTPALPAAPPSGSAIEDVSDFARLQALRELAAAAAIAAAGDLTTSSLTGDGLGYLDVNAIINNNDPSSIVAFLQAHSDETGADESLEIEIAGIVDYPNIKVVIFDQLIDGKHSIEGRSTIDFDPATGAVISAHVSLVTPDPALAASVVITRDEAVAIARAAIARYAQPRLRSGERLTMDATAKELRYALDPETNKARFEWPIWIDAGGIEGGWISWEVLVDASTGEITGTRDLVKYAAGVCSDLTFLVCNGVTMSREDQKCGKESIHPIKPLLATDSVAAYVIRQAKDMTAIIKVTDPNYIGAGRGLDCEVEIVVNAPESIMKGRPGFYLPGQDRIVLSSTAGRSTIAHEVMHALTQTQSAGVEHGLVDSAEALFMCGGDDKWTYGNEDFTDPPSAVSSGSHHSVAHAIFKIYGATNKDTAFKIVLGTDREAPNATSAHGVIFRVAKRVGKEATVTGIYKTMGIWPSQDGIDDIVDIVIEDMERKVGSLVIPTKAEMEDKVEELVNEQLRDGQFNQDTIFARVSRKAEEYRLEKAKDEYNKRLNEAMAQLTNAERMEIQAQYSNAQKKIQAATTVAIAQSNWEWIRDVIERIIKGREDDDTQVPVAPRSPPERPGRWPPGRPRPPSG